MFFSGFIPVFLFAQPSLGARLAKGLFDESFAGIYQLSAFDWMMLVPYFGILIVLSVYGIHRYETVRRYIKYGRKLGSTPPAKFKHLPKVTIQLPLYNERFVVE